MCEAGYLFLLAKQVTRLAQENCYGCTGEFSGGQKDHMQGCLREWDQSVYVYFAPAMEAVRETELHSLLDTVQLFLEGVSVPYGEVRTEHKLLIRENYLDTLQHKLVQNNLRYDLAELFAAMYDISQGI